MGLWGHNPIVSQERSVFVNIFYSFPLFVVLYFVFQPVSAFSVLNIVHDSHQLWVSASLNHSLCPSLQVLGQQAALWPQYLDIAKESYWFSDYSAFLLFWGGEWWVPSFSHVEAQMESRLSLGYIGSYILFLSNLWSYLVSCLLFTSLLLLFIIY